MKNLLFFYITCLGVFSFSCNSSKKGFEKIDSQGKKYTPVTYKILKDYNLLDQTKNIQFYLSDEMNLSVPVSYVKGEVDKDGKVITKNADANEVIRIAQFAPGVCQEVKTPNEWELRFSQDQNRVLNFSAQDSVSNFTLNCTEQSKDLGCQIAYGDQVRILDSKTVPYLLIDLTQLNQNVDVITEEAGVLVNGKTPPKPIQKPTNKTQKNNKKSGKKEKIKF